MSREGSGPTSVDDALVVLLVRLGGVLCLLEVDGRGTLELAAGIVGQVAGPQRTDGGREQLLRKRGPG